MACEPSISVAMATFNGAMHLREQLESLRAQTLNPAELVITDDGSSDGTEAIVRRFSATAPFPVRWHANAARLGYRANFMRAASLCDGTLIAFCDQDDIWYPEKLSVAGAAFSNPDVLFFHHEARVLRDGVITANSVKKVSGTDTLVPAMMSAPWQFPFGYTQVFRASLRDYNRLWAKSSDFKAPSDRASHDQWYFFLATALGSIAFHPQPLADYRQHETNSFGIGASSQERFDRLKFLIENRIPMYRQMHEAAGSRGIILCEAAEHYARSSADRDRLRVASVAWEDLALSYRARTDLYQGRALRRVRAGFRLLRRQAYSRRGFWTFGTKAAAKDLVLGAVLAPVVRRYGRPASSVDWNCSAGDGRAIATAYSRLNSHTGTPS
jgi:glycosyltransferase involved in cell wall biosynthesis